MRPISGDSDGLRLFSSGSKFEPSSPPGTHGTPVFPDINFDGENNGEGSPSVLRNSDPNAVFVVTGASRGIGLQFVKSLFEHTQGNIVACCRSPESASGLLEFRSRTTDPDRIQMVQLDLEDPKSVERVGNDLQAKFQRIDLLLNVAGLLGDAKNTPGPERSLTKIESTWMEQSFRVNTMGPVLMTQALAPLMVQRRTSKKVENPRPPSVVVNLSARVGSISDNSLGGWYTYRMSKAALNQFTRTVALEMKRQQVWCISVHPGTTDTDLSKPFQGNVKPGSLFPVEFTVAKLLDVIDHMQEENSGGLYDWAGQSLSF